MSALTALQQALRLRDQPEWLTDLQRAPLPPDIRELIRIATGEAGATDSDRDAAATFLQQVCLHAGADPRRCLALLAHDDLRTARRHHRLLIQWLHPDRNPGAQVLAERVNMAWTRLKNPLATTSAGESARPSAPVPRTRFPLFLGLLLLSVLALLAISLLPQTPVYVVIAERTDYQARSAGPIALAAAQSASRALPAVSTPVTAPDPVSAAEAEVLLQQYQAHYRAGNLSGLMALFSPKASSLNGGFEAIAADNSRLFSSTRQRRMTLSNPRWQTVDDARRLRAGFQSEQIFGTAYAPQRRSGHLEMLVVRENGKPRILELLITE